MLICSLLHDGMAPPELVKEPETEAEPELWPPCRPSPWVADGDDSKAGWRLIAWLYGGPNSTEPSHHSFRNVAGCEDVGEIGWGRAAGWVAAP